MDNSELRSTLNRLIRTCRDGQEGFRTAAENVSDVEIRKVCNIYSLQRAQFTGALQDAAHLLGDRNPEYASSLPGVLHRGWMNLRTAVAGRDSHAILAECAEEEDRAATEYKNSLALGLPAHIRGIVQHQYAEIQKAHDHVKALRDAGKPS